ncbi:hypothetical protein EFR01_49150 [Sinorhizobium fredii]|nr:hypothetical protein EFR01_49150 [Sinorhizobium fredii]GLS08100.1 hypothetical protein GCM10007864_17290 [Sinorhizobium fredii]
MDFNRAAKQLLQRPGARKLVALVGDDRVAYTDGKADHLWQLIRRADQWAKDVGWKVGLTDA